MSISEPTHCLSTIKAIFKLVMVESKEMHVFNGHNNSTPTWHEFSAAVDDPGAQPSSSKLWGASGGNLWQMMMIPPPKKASSNAQNCSSNQKRLVLASPLTMFLSNSPPSTSLPPSLMLCQLWLQECSCGRGSQPAAEPQGVMDAGTTGSRIHARCLCLCWVVFRAKCWLC